MQHAAKITAAQIERLVKCRNQLLAARRNLWPGVTRTVADVLLQKTHFIRSIAELENQLQTTKLGNVYPITMMGIGQRRA